MIVEWWKSVNAIKDISYSGFHLNFSNYISSKIIRWLTIKKVTIIDYIDSQWMIVKWWKSVNAIKDIPYIGFHLNFSNYKSGKIIRWLIVKKVTIIDYRCAMNNCWMMKSVNTNRDISNWGFRLIFSNYKSGKFIRWLTVKKVTIIDYRFAINDCWMMEVCKRNQRYILFRVPFELLKL
jgi:hypothetical protein